MNRIARPSLTGFALVAVVSGLVGCGGPAKPGPEAAPASSVAPNGPKLPARPIELRLDGVNPCSLITDEQAQQSLETSGGVFGAAAPGDGSPLAGDGCLWGNFPDRPDNQWFGSTVLHQGAEFALGREPLRTVDGFAATTTGSSSADPGHYCALLVDVAPGQAVFISYANERKDYPGMNHQLACDKAQQAAEFMITNLRAIKQR